MLLCGVDEAGRGPVIGPLVLCGVSCTPEQEAKLKSLGVKDSKKLTAQQRETLFPEILKNITGHKIEIVPPEEIDDAVSSSSSNLNYLEAAKTQNIARALKPDKLILDCPSTNKKAYKDHMAQALNMAHSALVVEHKADVNYPVVSAASILAKVTRDKEIEKIKLQVGTEIGSGYPSDPVTVAFLDKHWATYPEIFRHTWAPYKKKLAAQEQTSLSKFEKGR